jgi:hypothetical protein
MTRLRRYCCPEEPDIMLIGNLRVNGELKSMFVNAAEDWHIDQIQTTCPTHCDPRPILWYGFIRTLGVTRCVLFQIS